MYEKIKKICRDKGVSIYRLEKELGLSRGSVCKWSNSMPGADTLQKVADYLGVTQAELLS